MLAPAGAILLWMRYGGSVYLPELAALVGGHILNAGLTIAFGAAAAAVTEHPSTGAIVTLSATAGTWIVSFFAAVQGGLWERVAAFTPSAIVADFQHGLIRLDSTLIAITLILTGLAAAAIWQQTGLHLSRRLARSAALAGLCAAVIAGCLFARMTWDVSENRMNSFPKADELALRTLHDPLRIVVHLAPEDPRRADLEHRALAKLRRVAANLDIQYLSSTSTGLYEQTAAGYGEITYSMNGRSTTSRATTVEAVLEAVYSVAAVQPPKESDEPVYRGHALNVAPTGAAAIFYGLWPTLTVLSALLTRRR